MQLPFTFGGLREPGVKDFARMLRKLLPDGYSQEDDALFFYELEAYAKIFKYRHEQRRRLLGNMSARTTIEMIDEWERAFGLVDDAIRETSERQKRLVAAESARGGASAPRIATALAAVQPADPVTVQPITRAELEAVGVSARSPQMLFQLLAIMSEADFADLATRRALETVLSRIVPARTFGQDGASIAESLSTGVANWGSGTSVLGRAHVSLGTTSVASDAGMPSTRLREYGPGSIVRERDLTTFQAAVLRRGRSPTFDYTAQPAEQFAIAIATHATAHTGLELDTSIDWRNRICFLTVRWCADSSDIRPGQSGDTGFATSGTQFSEVVYFGAGNTSPLPGSSYVVTLVSGLCIFADASTGQLRCENSTGTGYVIVGVLTVGARYFDAALAPYVINGVDGQAFDAAGLDDTHFAALRDRALMRRANGVGVDTWTHYEGAGSRSAIAYRVNLARTSTTLLDDTMDWRDRVIVVTHGAMDPTLWSGLNDYGGPIGADRHTDDDADLITPDRYMAPAETADPSASALVVGYSGVGVASGAGAHGSMMVLSAHLRIWVSTTTGHLNITRDAIADAHGLTVLLTIEASMQTGQRVVPSHTVTLSVAGGDPVSSSYLNVLQDRSLLGVAAESQALGTQLHDHARVALPRLPETFKAYGASRPQQRSAVGGVRRWFGAFVAAGGDALLDDGEWRDRYVRIVARWSTLLHILPGQTDDLSANSTALVTRGAVARYTGTGGRTRPSEALNSGYQLALVLDVSTPDTGMCIYADTSNGVLRLRNKMDDDQYVIGWIDASFRLGLRDFD